MKTHTFTISMYRNHNSNIYIQIKITYNDYAHVNHKTEQTTNHDGTQTIKTTINKTSKHIKTHNHKYKYQSYRNINKLKHLHNLNA